MPIDPNIYGQLDTQAPLRLSQLITQATDQMPRYVNNLKLKSLMGEQELQGMQLEKGRGELERDKAYREALAGGGSLSDISARLRTVDPEKALAMEKASREAKAGVLDYQDKLFKHSSRAWTMLGETPDDETVISIAKDTIAKYPEMADQTRQMTGKILSMPPEKRQETALLAVQDIDKQYEAKFGRKIGTKLIETEGGQILVNEETGVPIAEYGAKPPTDRQPTDYDRWMKDPEGYRQYKEAGREPDVESSSPLSEGAIDAAATRYLIDGTLPPMGIGKAGAMLKTEILNRAAIQAQSTGMDPEAQRQFQIGTSVNKTALSQLSKQKAMVGAFEKNFVKNADLALQASNDVDRTGIPIVNKWLQAGKKATTSQPELRRFDIALKATVNEYAKIISGSMGNTAMAEGEIKKVEGLLNAAQTPEDVESVIDFMKLETANRMAGFDAQQEELRAGMALPKGNTGGQTTGKPSTAEDYLKKFQGK